MIKIAILWVQLALISIKLLGWTDASWGVILIPTWIMCTLVWIIYIIVMFEEQQK